MNPDDKQQKPRPEPFREGVKDNIRPGTGDDVRKHVWDVINTKPAPEPEKSDSSEKK
jgi:hypothetical protein